MMCPSARMRSCDQTLTGSVIALIAEPSSYRSRLTMDLRGMLVVMGGHSGITALRTDECQTLAEHTWQFKAKPLSFDHPPLE